MTKKTETEIPESRELTPGETAANAAHEAAHAAAVKQEKEITKVIKERLEAEDLGPGMRPDQLAPTPDAGTARAADVFPTRAEQHGGATGPDADSAAPAARSRSASHAPESKKH